MQQYPQSPDVTGAAQPPVYHQDPATSQYPQQQYAQQYAQQYPQQPQSPPPQIVHPVQPGQPQSPYEQQQKAYPHPEQPGMPPQQASGPVYQNATPIASLGRGPAPADCPACGQRSMTNCAFETGNTTHAWAFGLCCLCCLGCIPYIMNSLKDVTHKCGRCGVLLATWHRSGTTEVHIHS
ncbi:LITAF-like zinc finger domain-containing protein [Stagonosporopsis vannaccii]|nr:LITAF-like zinc finger domain-containing protein [Stagonosporopsis vannaccii]